MPPKTHSRTATHLGKQSITLGSITLDAGTQLPTRRSKATIDDYAQQMQDEQWEWEREPLPVLFSDGDRYYPGDGHHRIEAAGQAECDTILCEIRPGGLLNAKLFSAQANRFHGLQLTRKDKRAKCAMIFADPALLEALATELGQPGALPSDRVIADYLGVSAPLVGEVRKEYEAMGTVNILSERVDRSGRKINTENIGRKPTAPEESPDPSEKQLELPAPQNLAAQFAKTLEAAPPPSGKKVEGETAATIHQACLDYSAYSVIEVALEKATERELEAIQGLVQKAIDNW